MSARVGKVLWALKSGNPLPYLCVDVFEDTRGVTHFTLVNLTDGDTLTIFEHDVDNMRRQELVRWDDA